MLVTSKLFFRTSLAPSLNWVCSEAVTNQLTTLPSLAYLFLSEYWLNSRLRLQIYWRLIKYSYLSLVWTGIICILVARGHYSVDIVLAIILASSVFFTYHCASDSAQMSADISPRYRTLWWFTLFAYVESDVIKYKNRGTEYVVENVFEFAELFSLRLWKKR